MHYLVLVVALIAIVLAIIFKINGLSMFYPTLLIILAVILDVLSNVISERKNKKMDEELKNRVKK
ncbi:MAG: hypothetical protein J6A15_06535 [Clostridia bacterium]|nr:hypothetical protein [Clostridia bacterium]